MRIFFVEVIAPSSCHKLVEICLPNGDDTTPNLRRVHSGPLAHMQENLLTVARMTKRVGSFPRRHGSDLNALADLRLAANQ